MVEEEQNDQKRLQIFSEACFSIQPLLSVAQAHDRCLGFPLRKRAGVGAQVLVARILFQLQGRTSRLQQKSIITVFLRAGGCGADLNADSHSSAPGQVASGS